MSIDLTAERASLLLDSIQPNQFDNKRDLLNKEFFELVSNYHPNLSLKGNYYHFEPVQNPQGWILNLSAILPQLTNMLKAVIPFLLKANVPFKFPKSLDFAVLMLDGTLGNSQIAKVLTIYPASNKIALNIAKELVKITKEFRGPAIPTYDHLAGIVYASYIQPNGLDNTLYSKDTISSLNETWPFTEIRPLDRNSPPKLLNNKYYPVQTIKSDAKGKVTKALYFHNIFSIKNCLIKEANHDMITDVFERDIRDRLAWQSKLHKELSNTRLLPKFLNYYEDRNNHYLVTEFVKGKPLNDLINATFSTNTWPHLTMKQKLHLLKMLLKILKAIQTLHDQGYVHRDINPWNILVRQKKEQIVLIDMELAWSLKNVGLHHPFKWGTPGFMSPQQREVLEPTIKEDIYGLGATMIVIFTNLHPHKVPLHYSNSFNNLSLLIGEDSIVQIIEDCLLPSPSARPTISEMEDVIKTYIGKLNKPSQHPAILTPKKEIQYSLDPIINAAFKGLSHPLLLNKLGIWQSRIHNYESEIVNEIDSLRPIIGWHTGIAGTLWTIAKAKQLGVNITDTEKVFHANWEYLKTHCKEIEELTPGLYSGAAGVALSVHEMLKCGLINPNESVVKLLQNSFNQMSPIGGLASGLAGQGIALIACSIWITQEQLSNRLNGYISRLLSEQLPNGAWIIQPSANSLTKNWGFSEGVPGITWFLLSAYPKVSSPMLAASIKKALNWIYSTMKEPSPNIILTFLKAFETFNDSCHYRMIQKMLQRYPQRKLWDQLTLNGGMAAWGDTYLEAARILKDDIFLERAKWIAQLIAGALHIDADNQGYWLTKSDENSTADLFHGNAGLIYFLLRVQHFSKLNHLLCPTN